MFKKFKYWATLRWRWRSLTSSTLPLSASMSFSNLIFDNIALISFRFKEVFYNLVSSFLGIYTVFVNIAVIFVLNSNYLALQVCTGCNSKAWAAESSHQQCRCFARTCHLSMYQLNPRFEITLGCSAVATFRYFQEWAILGQSLGLSAKATSQTTVSRSPLRFDIDFVFFSKNIWHWFAFF